MLRPSNCLQDSPADFCKSSRVSAFATWYSDITLSGAIQVLTVVLWCSFEKTPFTDFDVALKKALGKEGFTTGKQLLVFDWTVESKATGGLGTTDA